MQLDEVDTRIRLFDPNTPQKIDELLPRIAEQEAKVEELRAQGWELNREPRLKELGWTGGLEAYLRTTLIAGRPPTVRSGTATSCRHGDRKPAARCALTKSRIWSLSS